jgi:predicted membrane metal-binding protein
MFLIYLYTFILTSKTHVYISNLETNNNLVKNSSLNNKNPIDGKDNDYRIFTRVKENMKQNDLVQRKNWSSNAKPEISRDTYVTANHLLSTNTLIYQSKNSIYSQNDLESGKRPSILAEVDLFTQNLKKHFQMVLPAPASAIAMSLLFNNATHFDPNVAKLLTDMNLLHLISPNGQTTSILVSFFLQPFQKGKQKKSMALIVCFLIFSYFVISGFTATLLRVLILSVISFVALVFHRQRSTLYFFLLSLFFVLFLFPTVVSTLAFQCSATAGLGIILFAPLWKKTPLLVLENKKRKGLIAGNVFVDGFLQLIKGFLVIYLSAQVFTLPLLLFKMGTLDIRAIFANIAVGWILPFLIILSFLSLFVFCAVPSLLPILAFFHWLASSLFLGLAESFDSSSLHFLVLNIRVSFVEMIFLWMVGGFFYFFLKEQRKRVSSRPFFRSFPKTCYRT